MLFLYSLKFYAWLVDVTFLSIPRGFISFLCVFFDCILCNIKVLIHLFVWLSINYSSLTCKQSKWSDDFIFFFLQWMDTGKLDYKTATLICLRMLLFVLYGDVPSSHLSSGSSEIRLSVSVFESIQNDAKTEKIFSETEIIMDFIFHDCIQMYIQLQVSAEYTLVPI